MKEEIAGTKRGLIAGYKPNRISLYILMLTTGRLDELADLLYKDMAPYKEGKEADVIEQKKWIEANQEEFDMLAWENNNFASYLGKVLGATSEQIQQIANGWPTDKLKGK
tara:strand:+ start:1039 stop:1368 length:330 start_codon:yes stop_codon:yes gene_type:complete